MSRSEQIQEERNYGIDLLRIVLIFMICMMHALDQGGIVKSCTPGTLKYKVFWFIEIFSYCAVDGFAIISGYMSKDRPVKQEKLILMWFQVFFYSFIVTVILKLAGAAPDMGKTNLLKCAFPVTYNKYWYFTAYFCLFLGMPLLNKYLFSLDTEKAKKAFLLLFIIFSCIGVMKDPFNTRNGYSPFWIIILYCMGVLARKINLFEKRSAPALIGIWAASLLITWFLFIKKDHRILINYISPTILLSGLIMVVLFSRLRLKGNIIKRISPLVFGVYLLQLNEIIWNKYLNGAFAFVVRKSLRGSIVYAFLFALLIFCAGLIVEYLRKVLEKVCKIDKLSQKAAAFIDKVLSKISVILK